MSNLRKTVMGRNIHRSGLSRVPSENYAPVKWSQYFDREESVKLANDEIFHIYRRGTTGPIVLCLHGGGYSGLTWALLTEELIELVECQVVAVDLRGHGNTRTSNDSNISLEQLAQDVVELIEILAMNANISVILIGHSMGGAVAVETARRVNVSAVCIIDVVEDTALEALSSMQTFLRSRPKGFHSIQHAIQWCYRGSQTMNLDAAKVSMPGQIVNLSSGVLAANELDNIELINACEFDGHSGRTRSMLPPIIDENAVEPPANTSSLTNGDVDVRGNSQTALEQQSFRYGWRIDLSNTEPFWMGWYSGLSQKFLDISAPKLLFLASIHGLDTKLMVGQMQGKFQLQVLPRVGHAIHEDQPAKVAELLASYLVKQKLVVGRTNVSTMMPAC